MSEKFVEQLLFNILNEGEAEEAWEDEDLKHYSDFQARASAAGADFKEMALHYVIAAGAKVLKVRFHENQLPVDALVEGRNKKKYLVLSRGTPDTSPTSGLRRSDTVLKVGFVATHLALEQKLGILVITSHLPERSSASGDYLSKLGPYVTDVIATTGDLLGFQRLNRLIHGPSGASPFRMPWREPKVEAQEVLKNFHESAEVEIHHIPNP